MSMCFAGIWDRKVQGTGLLVYLAMNCNSGTQPDELFWDKVNPTRRSVPWWLIGATCILGHLFQVLGLD